MVKQGYKQTDVGVIPEDWDVRKIGDFAFRDCKKIESIVIPEGVTEIGWSAFSNCRNLTSIVFSGIETKIGYNAFSGCENLTTITTPEGVRKIERDNSIREAVAERLTEIDDDFDNFDVFDDDEDLLEDEFDDFIFFDDEVDLL